MDINPVITVFAAANRPELWMKLYTNLSTSKTPFEIIFVGNVHPQFDLPDNFHFIYSTVKPSQCYYIAAHHSKGEYLVNIADDETFSDNILDILLKAYDDKTSIISPQLYSHTGEILAHGFWETEEDPILPVSSFMHQCLWKEIDGMDSEFIALYWDTDVAMQVYKRGGQVKICKDATVAERGIRGLKGRLCFVKGDRSLFHSLWYNSNTGKFRDERKFPVTPFTWTDDIMKVSQGRTDPRWT